MPSSPTGDTWYCRSIVFQELQQVSWPSCQHSRSFPSTPPTGYIPEADENLFDMNILQLAVLVTLQPFMKLALLCCHDSDSLKDEEVEACSRIIAANFEYPNSLNVKVLEPVVCS